MNTEIVVIGSGSSGLTTAIGLAKIGYQVTIIESEFFGGDCTNFGCIPSKALLSRAAEFYNNQLYNSSMGISVEDAVYQKQAELILEQTRQVVWEFQEHESLEWLENQGLTVIKGVASFVDSHTLMIQDIDWDQTSSSMHNAHETKKGIDSDIHESQSTSKLSITFKKAVICTGSSTFIPAIKGIESVPYLTNKTIFSLSKVPTHLVIIGNGPIGVEMAEAFLHLGSSVTMIGKSDSILPRSEPSIAKALQDILHTKGLKYYNAQTESISYLTNTFTITLTSEMGNVQQNSIPKNITHDNTQNNVDNNTIKTQSVDQFMSVHNKNSFVIHADQLLIATGRQPNLPNGLKKAHVKYSQNGIHINSNTRTATKNIYAVGDVVANVPRFTHFAGYMASKTVTNLAIRKLAQLPFDCVRYSTKNVPAITFTSPEIAECGYTYNEAKQKFGSKLVRKYELSYNDIDRAKTHEHEQGAIILITKGFWGTIIGAHIIGSRAGEMLPEIQTLITQNKSIRALSGIIRAYPSYTANLDTLFKQWLVSLFQK